MKLLIPPVIALKVPLRLFLICRRDNDMNDKLLDIAVFVDVQNIYYTTKQAFKKTLTIENFGAMLKPKVISSTPRPTR